MLPEGLTDSNTACGMLNHFLPADAQQAARQLRHTQFSIQRIHGGTACQSSQGHWASCNANRFRPICIHGLAALSVGCCRTFWRRGGSGHQMSGSGWACGRACCCGATTFTTLSSAASRAWQTSTPCFTSLAIVTRPGLSTSMCPLAKSSDIRANVSKLHHCPASVVWSPICSSLLIVATLFLALWVPGSMSLVSTALSMVDAAYAIHAAQHGHASIMIKLSVRCAH